MSNEKNRIKNKTNGHMLLGAIYLDRYFCNFFACGQKRPAVAASSSRRIVLPKLSQPSQVAEHLASADELEHHVKVAVVLAAHMESFFVGG